MWAKTSLAWTLDSIVSLANGSRIATLTCMKTLVLWGALTLAPVGFVATVSAQTSLARAPVKWPTIRAGDDEGSFDARIAAAQYLLRARGFYKGRADGIYGAKTVAAVKAFQRKNKLFVDGVAGPQTLRKLVVTVKLGSKGDAVRAAQILARPAMNHIGGTPNMGLELDGTYGRETEGAVSFAQAAVGDPEELIKPDGIMGPRSWCLLLGGEVVGRD